jgi:hypothetical protein
VGAEDVVIGGEMIVSLNDVSLNDVSLNDVNSNDVSLNDVSVLEGVGGGGDPFPSPKNLRTKGLSFHSSRFLNLARHSLLAVANVDVVHGPVDHNNIRFAASAIAIATVDTGDLSSSA